MRRAGLKAEDVLSTRLLRLASLDAELIRADGVEQRLRFTAAGKRDADAAFRRIGKAETNQHDGCTSDYLAFHGSSKKEVPTLS